MYKLKEIADKVYYVGVNDRQKALFENMWPLDRGVSYNSYLIDDEKGVTIVAASTLEPEVKAAVESGAGKDAAKAVGQAVAKKAVDAGITEVVFDRGGYIFHGRVKELAEGAREGGLKF